MGQQRRKRLGLIGFGRFGRFAAAHLRHHLEVVATDRADLRREAEALGIRWGRIADAARCPYVVLAVPVQALGEVLEEAAPHLRPGTLVADVGSVKAEPVRRMLTALPEEVEVVGTHPLFGPSTGGPPGARIVLCPGRTRRLDQIRRFLVDQLGLEVVVTDPESHDRQIAATQALAHYLGRAVAALGLSDSIIRTPSYGYLRLLAESAEDDSWELFAAIQNLNPHAAEVRRRLRQALEELEGRLAADLSATGA